MSGSGKSDWIKAKAHLLGFTLTGISRAEKLEKEARDFEAWLNAGHHGKMGYMENHFEKRVDPTKLFPGAKSVISLLYNYYNPEKQSDPEAPKLSMYAYGRDYHKVLKKKLKILLQEIQDHFGEVSGRCFVDSAPILERDWAKKSGLGWIGKNTLLIHPKKGSYFFLSELIVDLELEYDQAIRDHCGTCTKCIDACPTDAITPNGYVLDASKCISYLSIELKEELPDEFRHKMDGWMFGCDICQDVCPWNKFAAQHNEASFNPKEEVMKMSRAEWEEITEDVFNELFNGSAVKRTNYHGLKRNINFLKKI